MDYMHPYRRMSLQRYINIGWRFMLKTVSVQKALDTRDLFSCASAIKSRDGRTVMRQLLRLTRIAMLGGQFTLRRGGVTGKELGGWVSRGP